MKKALFFVAALAMALTISCTKEQAVQTAQEGEETLVSFTISAPEGISTRALSLGTSANTLGDGVAAERLHYTVKDNATKTVIYDGCVEDAFAGNSLTTTLTLSLLVGGYYDVAFWADAAADKTPYEYNEGVVTISTMDTATHIAKKPNDESYDAFYWTSKSISGLKCLEITPETSTISVELKRPFAQINIAASLEDLTAADQVVKALNPSENVCQSGMTVDYGGASVDYTQTFDIFNDKLSNTKCKLVYQYSNIPQWDVSDPGSYPCIIYANGNTPYAVIATVYVFATASGNTCDISFNWGSESAGVSTPFYDNTFESVPIKRNYKTNIVGSVLTKATTFNIEIVPSFKTDDNVITKSTVEDLLDGTIYYNETVNNGNYGKIYNMGGGVVTIENKTVVFSRKPYGGLNQADTIKFKNCVIEGTLFGYTPLKFEDCTFMGDQSFQIVNTIYPIWTYGATSVSFKNCDFDSWYPKAILVYNEGSPSYITVNVDGCNFNARYTQIFENNRKAAVEIHTECGISGEVNIKNSTINARYNSLWAEYNNQTQNNTTNFVIKVNGTQVSPVTNN